MNLNTQLLAVATLCIAAGAIGGAAFDTPVMNFINPQPKSYGYADRVERLQYFPPQGDIAFVGDSHVERGDWNTILGRTDIANWGISGDVTEGVLSRPLPEAESTILLLGTNDLAAGRTPDAIASDIHEIIERIDGQVLLVSVLPTRGRYAARNLESKKLNTKIQGYCTERCHFIDAWPSLATDGKLKAEYSSDGMHLSAKGYEALGALLSSHLSRDQRTP